MASKSLRTGRSYSRRIAVSRIRSPALLVTESRRRPVLPGAAIITSCRCLVMSTPAKKGNANYAQPWPGQGPSVAGVTKPPERPETRLRSPGSRNLRGGAGGDILQPHVIPKMLRPRPHLSDLLPVPRTAGQAAIARSSTSAGLRQRGFELQRATAALRPVASLAVPAFYVRLIICDRQFNGQDLIFTSTKPATGQMLPKGRRIGADVPRTMAL